MHKKKAALVLSGGGARGIAHIGVIEELQSQGYEITSVAGTSMGAFVGGIYATGNIEAFKTWILSLDKTKIFRLIDFSFTHNGLIKGDKVMNEMRTFIPDTDIAELKIPFAAVAADIINKKEIVFTSGSLYRAIRASVAIPTIFTPVKTEDGLLIDGGAVNNIPVNRVKRHSGDTLIVVNVNANVPVIKPEISAKENRQRESDYRNRIREFRKRLQEVIPVKRNQKLGYFDIITKTINLMILHNAMLTLEKYKPDMLIEISRESCGTFDFFKAREMMETGHIATRKILQNHSS